MNATSEGEELDVEIYHPCRVPEGIELQVRGLRYRVRHWPALGKGRRSLILLHGWMDVSASFQFLVDELPSDWECFAPDWRGFGLSDSSGTDTYWFADYLADLEAVLQGLFEQNRIFPPINLLGHSMGGNIACLYAGVRPERIARLINLEGFGLSASDPAKAPARYARWLDGLAAGAPVLRAYASRHDVAQRLMHNNPRLQPDRAHYLALHWAARGDDGQWQLRADPWHKATHPVSYRADEVRACWSAIRAPVLWVSASDTCAAPESPTEAMRSSVAQLVATPEYQARLRDIADLRTAVIDGAGHMVHHDQPAALAHRVLDFVGR
jgi:pimeloyl-ACP methyl ester carboxylesterase